MRFDLYAPTRSALSLALAAALLGCTDRLVEPEQAARPTGTQVTRLDCFANVQAQTFGCTAPRNRANADAGLVTLGGQGTYVQLTASDVSYNPANSKFLAYLTVQNLTAQVLGTLDGEGVTGVDVFVNSGPINGGAVTLETTLFGAFSGTNQPYMHYDEVLDAFGGISQPKLWTFNVPSSVAAFNFTVLVSANVGERDGALRWTVDRGFATFSSTAIWGADSRNVFAFGNVFCDCSAATTVNRFDGVTWHSMGVELPYDIFDAWGSSASDVWAIGQSANIAHYNGSVWTTTQLEGHDVLNSIWGSGRNDVYVLGESLVVNDTTGASELRSTLSHYDGTVWTPVNLPAELTAYDYQAIGGSARDNIWMVSSVGTIIHFDGTAWTSEVLPAGAAEAIGAFNAVFAVDKEAWAVGNGGSLHYTGGAWNLVSASAVGFSKVHGSSPSNVWALGFATLDESFSGVLRWNPATNTWTPVPLPNVASFAALWTSGPNDVWAVGDYFSFDDFSDFGATLGVPWHWNGSSWTAAGSHRGFLSGSLSGGDSLNATFSIDGSDVWAVGTSGQILRKAPTGWQQVDERAGNNWTSVWGISDKDIWIVGDSGRMRHWDGSTLADASVRASASVNFTGVFGFSSTDVWAVGNDNGNPVVLHLVDGAWVAGSFGDVSFYEARAIWGRAPDDIWVVGYYNLMHWDGSRWSEVFTPGEGTLYAVHGTSDGQIVAVGDNGRIIRYNPNLVEPSWVYDTSPTQAHLYGLYSDGRADHMVAVGSDGMMLRYTGSRWVRVNSGVSNNIRGIWLNSLSNVFIVGAGDFIAHGVR